MQCDCILSTNYLSGNQDYTLCTVSSLGCFVRSFFVNPPEPCQTVCMHTTFEIISANYAKDYISDSNDSMIINVYYETLNVQTLIQLCSPMEPKNFLQRLEVS